MKQLITVCMLVLVSGFTLQGAVALQPSPALVRIDPAQLEMSPGVEYEVAVRLENAADIYAIDVKMSFDPQRLEVLDMSPDREGVQVARGELPKPDFVALETADNSTGLIHYIVTQINPTPPAQGDGTIFTIRLRPVSAGTAALAFESVETANRDGFLLDVITEDAEFQIVSSGIALDPADTMPATVEASPTAVQVLQPTPTNDDTSRQSEPTATSDATATLPEVATAPQPQAATSSPTVTPSATLTATALPLVTVLRDIEATAVELQQVVVEESVSTTAPILANGTVEAVVVTDGIPTATPYPTVNRTARSTADPEATALTVIGSQEQNGHAVPGGEARSVAAESEGGTSNRWVSNVMLVLFAVLTLIAIIAVVLLVIGRQGSAGQE